MRVRELKREIEELKSFSLELDNFKKKFSENFVTEDKELINKVNEINEHVSIIMDNDVEKRLKIHARDLMQLELAKIREDHKMVNMLQNKLFHDEVLSLNMTEDKILQNGQNLKLLKQSHNEINKLLQLNMSLEQQLDLYGQLHHYQLDSLINLNERHHKITRDIKRHIKGVKKND